MPSYNIPVEIGPDPDSHDETISQIRPGVSVVLKARVLSFMDAEGFFRCIAGDHSLNVHHSAITEIDPRPLQFNDVVEADILEEVMGEPVAMKRLGVVKGIDGGLAWVRWENGIRAQVSVSSLTLKHVRMRTPRGG